MHPENVVILVIEDEETIRENLVEILENEGFTLLAAENGVIGLSLAQRHHPDLILCDVMMPQLDGYGVLKALRENLTTALTPFIFLTARADRSDQRRGMNLGADDYITKPFSRAELLEAIAGRLNKANSQQQHDQLIAEATRSQLEQAYHYDQVTGLPNRFLLRESFNKIVATRCSLDELVTILSVQIQQIRQVDIILESSQRQDLLKQLTQRLTQNLGEEDAAFLIDYDQYLIVAGTPRSRSEVDTFVRAVHQAMAQPIEIGQLRIRLSVVIGISCFPEDDIQLDMLVRNAHLAASVAPPDIAIHFYTPIYRTRTREQLILEADLSQALEQSWFRVFYQPKIDCRSGQITGAEALLRCDHPEKGLLPPWQFIPVAEATGLILPIGQQVLQQVCQHQQQWHQHFGTQIPVAVNLSPLQFSQANLYDTIAAQIQDYQLPPHCLEFEITETCLMTYLEQACVTLNALKQLGITLAIDDFGTGYSSLQYLQSLPVDTVKIDQCFIRDIDGHPKNAGIVQAVMRLCQDLNLKIVAEGVETPAEANFVRAHGGDQLQGYYFSRPIPEPEFCQLLQTWQVPQLFYETPLGVSAGVP